MGEFQCNFCGFQYEERNGDTKNGIPKGTLFQQLAGSLCNRCGMQGDRHERQATEPYIGLEAEYYDLFAGKSGESFYKQWLTSFISPVVLELGVGTGRIAFELANAGVNVTGIDISEDMLAIAEKKKKRLKDSNNLNIIQEDAMSYMTSTKYTHVLLTDGFIQHFLLPEDQRRLLLNVKKQLVDGGLILIDITLPPNESEWKLNQCKQWGKRRIYQTIKGQTSLSRQIFETTITFETYEQNIEQSKFQVDREYSLILPRELAYLLQTEGFEVIDMFENYQMRNKCVSATTLLPHLVNQKPELSKDETLDEKRTDLSRMLRPYEQDVWTNGGYPLPIQSQKTNETLNSRFTIIAKIKN